MLPDLSLSAAWSIPKKIVRICSTLITLRSAELPIRAKSCTGASVTISSSPDNNAATLVAALAIGSN